MTVERLEVDRNLRPDAPNLRRRGRRDAGRYLQARVAQIKGSEFAVIPWVGHGMWICLKKYCAAVCRHAHDWKCS